MPVPVKFFKKSAAGGFQAFPQVIVRMLGPGVSVEMNGLKPDRFGTDLMAPDIKDRHLGALGTAVNGNNILFFHEVSFLKPTAFR
jgi:hypothetical protein